MPIIRHQYYRLLLRHHIDIKLNLGITKCYVYIHEDKSCIDKGHSQYSCIYIQFNFYNN